MGIATVDVDCLDANDPVSVTETDAGLTVEVWGNTFFSHECLDRSQKLCEWLESADYPAVTFDLCRTTYFCTTSLGRLAKCIAAFKREGRTLRIRAKAYAYRALLAIGFDHVVPVECCD